MLKSDMEHLIRCIIKLDNHCVIPNTLYGFVFGTFPLHFGKIYFLAEESNKIPFSKGLVLKNAFLLKIFVERGMKLSEVVAPGRVESSI